MRTAPIRVGILSGQRLLCDLMESLFAKAGLEVVARFPNVESLLGAAQQVTPEVVLVDVGLARPDSEEMGDCVRAVKLLHGMSPPPRSLVLSAHRDMTLVECCFQAGAAGYLCTLDVGCAEVLSAVERVACGEWLVPLEFVRPLQTALDEPTSLAGRLTPREREVLCMVAVGADNLQIAARLDITERTVKAHVSNLYRKLGVHNRVEMAVMARQLGLSSPPHAKLETPHSTLA